MEIINSTQFDEVTSKGIVVVDFFANWCGPCKMLAPVFEQAGEEMKNDATFLKVDIDQSMDLAQKFKIVSVPTLKVFKNGEEITTNVGFLPKGALVEMINKSI